MERVPRLDKWFRSIRRLHDIHHRQISDDGRMSTNFGICFFFMDRIFGTLSPAHRPFNAKGYAVAEKRYAHLIDSPNRSKLSENAPSL
jgi:sterol desaturase/sphingolipid hydroxylase (fatty acid hydroxylase superfamily)